MTDADKYRKTLINNIITEGVQLNNRIGLKIKDGYGIYNEILTLDEIQIITENFTIQSSVSEFLNELVNKRLNNVFKEFGYIINEVELDLNSSNFYDGYNLNIPILKENYDSIEELFNEIDNNLNKPKINPELYNKASGVPINKEPYAIKTPNLPTQNNIEKTQNPKKVDFILKTVFDRLFQNYNLTSDVGKWNVVKSLKSDEKLFINWECDEYPSILINSLFFPQDTNKIVITVVNRAGDVLLKTYFEIYRIPTDELSTEKFFRKTYFSLLKKYIDTSVVQIDPFRTEFVFWKTDNPTFSYTFSSPDKNKIILDLISFINTARKPILDDFFEANNLKHKQGYLQALLDASEAAGIFEFKREGNEILILRGPNYKAFLEGKIRRVVS